MTEPTPKVKRVRVKKGNDVGVSIGIFALTFLLSMAAGYLTFTHPSRVNPGAAEHTQTTLSDQTLPDSSGADHAEHAETVDEMAEEAAPAVNASAGTEGKILSDKGCVGCHSVKALGISGGVTGPDLSQAYINVADKHGVPIEEFLKKPTSAVMSGVIGSNPLSDDELNQVLSTLKLASEK